MLICVFGFSTSALAYNYWNVSTYGANELTPQAACERWVASHAAGTGYEGYSFTGELTNVEYSTIKYRCELTNQGESVEPPSYEPYTWRSCSSVVCGCPPNYIEQADGGCMPGSEGEGESCPAVANPVNPGIGNKYQLEADYIGAGLNPLTARRYYNSVSATWQFLPEIIPAGLWAGPILVRGDGKKTPFSDDETSGWVADPHITGVLQSFDDGAGNITGWRYTTLDKQVEDYDASGKMLSVTDRSGVSHNYAYTATDITVTHSSGGTLTYQVDNSYNSYNSSYGRVIGFTTPDNKNYTYNYDPGENLIGITLPDNGGTRVYHYEDINLPNALTGITDENGDRFATWAYDVNGRAISSEHNGGAEKVTIDYTHIEDPTDPRTVVTNALGKQTTYHFVDIFGAWKVTQIEGHPSANCLAANKNYSYDTNGFVASKTDWKGNTTTYVRNTKGQEQSRTEAFGKPEARTITTEWHATFNLRTKVTEPDRETVYNYDATGNLLSQQTTDLTTP